jgi:hypothetical protein
MIKFTTQEIQDILNILGEIPSKYSFKLILLLQQKITTNSQEDNQSLKNG